MTEYRAAFDASVTFANGGGLTVHGFRVDVPDPGIGEAGIAALFVASLGLLMTESVRLSNVEIVASRDSAPSRSARSHGCRSRPPGRAGQFEDW
jgi:hypothetical protein